ncbi:serine hydrolase-like protein 2 [Rhinopithecus roxellana]|uniref:serine hydrolase-like protein 2 n=1 Tax=Rhinopithecus roxellana TaxID=61622 RepID=UPI001237711D|nr:serine hydrolase-like protein 2 [Rhinopithecus roxellana]
MGLMAAPNPPPLSISHHHLSKDEAALNTGVSVLKTEGTTTLPGSQNSGHHRPLLKTSSHLNEECGELLLLRGTTKVATGLVLNRDQRISWPENSFDLVSRELYAHSIRKLQAHVLFIKAVHGYFDVRRESYSDKESLSFMIHTLKSTLKERFQFVEVPSNHCVYMREPHHVASIISSFLRHKHTLTA